MEKVRARLGPDVALDTWQVVFDPASESEADRAHCVLLVQLPRHDDDLRVGREPEYLEQAVESLGDALRVRGQAQILQHDGRFVATQRRDRCGAIRRGNHFILGKGPPELLLQAQVVFNDQ